MEQFFLNYAFGKQELEWIYALIVALLICSGCVFINKMYIGFKMLHYELSTKNDRFYFDKPVFQNMSGILFVFGILMYIIGFSLAAVYHSIIWPFRLFFKFIRYIGSTLS